MNLHIRKIVYKIILKVSARLFKIIARQKWTRLPALLLRVNIQCLQKEAGSSKCIHLLILPKAGFTEDVIATFGGNLKFRVNALDRTIVKAIFLTFLPKEIDDNNYVSDDPSIEKKKKELRTYWNGVLANLKRLMKIDVVLTGNYSYAAEQELAAACIQVGIPFVAIHKECLKTPGLEDFYRKKYETRKGPFLGSKICVYNEIEKYIQEKAGVASPEDITVTGMPRLDKIHRLRQEMSREAPDSVGNKPSVLFFSFNEKTGLPFIGRKTNERFERLDQDLERLHFKTLARNCHIAMRNLAHQEPWIKVIVKTKGDVTAKRILAKYYGNSFVPPKNMKIVSGGDPMNLIANCDVVCGFNSTTLLEAASMSKPIVIPGFDEALMETHSPYILDLESMAYYAYSQDELIDTIRRVCVDSNKKISKTKLDAQTNRIIRKWTGNADGLSGHRVRTVIEKIVEDSKKKTQLNDDEEMAYL